MESRRPAPVAKRVAISVIALYALLLQAFVVAAAPDPAVEFSAGIICAQPESRSEAPAGEYHHHGGLCCILACAACGCAYVAAAATIAVFPDRAASCLVFGETPTGSARPPLKFYFAARGPPENL